MNVCNLIYLLLLLGTGFANLVNASTLTLGPTDSALAFSTGWTKSASLDGTEFMVTENMGKAVQITLPQNVTSLGYVGYIRATGAFYGVCVDCDGNGNGGDTASLQTFHASIKDSIVDVNTPVELFSMNLDPTRMHTVAVFNFPDVRFNQTGSLTFRSLRLNFDGSSTSTTTSSTSTETSAEEDGTASGTQTSTTAKPTSTSSEDDNGEDSSATATSTSAGSEPTSDGDDDDTTSKSATATSTDSDESTGTSTSAVAEPTSDGDDDEKTASGSATSTGSDDETGTSTSAGAEPTSTGDDDDDKTSTSSAEPTSTGDDSKKTDTTATTSSSAAGATTTDANGNVVSGQSQGGANNNTTTTTGKRRTSPALIIGIVTLCVLALAAILGGLYFFIIVRRRRRAHGPPHDMEGGIPPPMTETPERPVNPFADSADVPLEFPMNSAMMPQRRVIDFSSNRPQRSPGLRTSSFGNSIAPYSPMRTSWITNHNSR